MNFFETPLTSSQNLTSIVFLLHGWGANGRDLLSIAEIWKKYLPETHFICPEAPDVCDENPMGFQWFSLGKWSENEFINGAEKAREPLGQAIRKKMAEYQIPADKVVLMGFSQGMMMALSVGLRQEKPFAGILGYSGALIDGDDHLPVMYEKPDICLIHGEADPVIPVARHDQAVKWLKDHQYDVESLKVPGLGHGIEEQGLTLGLKFLKENLT